MVNGTCTTVLSWLKLSHIQQSWWNYNLFYYINTAEIPVKHLCRNMTSSLVNITSNVILTCEMITVYGYKINCAFHS